MISDALARPGRSRIGPRSAAALLAFTVAIGAAGCRAPAPPVAAYVPHARDVTVTTVPLLVKEAARLYPFLPPDFAPGGVLDGKEVYAFSPSTITVVAGDTIRFTFVNPEDDLHSFVLPDFSIALPGQAITHATYVAKRAGIFRFVCSVANHLPMMWGELVVLAPAAVADGSSSVTPTR